jgi:hypothetical protein
MQMNREPGAVMLPEFLSFRKMISPYLLQFLFWPAVIVGIYYNTLLDVTTGYHIVWWSLVSGILMLRIAFECLFLYTYLKRKL